MAFGSHIKMYYVEGKDAYKGGVHSAGLNPYPEGSAAANNWEAGWTDAWYSDTIENGQN